MYDDALAWAGSVLGSQVVSADPLDGGMTSTMLALRDEAGTEAVLRLMTNEPWLTHGVELTTRERTPSWCWPTRASRRRSASVSTPTGPPPGWRHT